MATFFFEGGATTSYILVVERSFLILLDQATVKFTTYLFGLIL
jgi:hypothetical protein